MEEAHIPRKVTELEENNKNHPNATERITTSKGDRTKNLNFYK